MITIALPRFAPLFPRARSHPEASAVYEVDAEEVTVRRECLESLLSSGCCVSEVGATALMGLIPSDF